MPPFDPTQSYGLLTGRTRARYVQFGRYYTVAGEEVTPTGDSLPSESAEAPTEEAAPPATNATPGPRDAAPVPPPRAAVPDPLPPADPIDPPLPPGEAPAVDEHGRVDNIDLEQVDWRQLRRWVRAAGQPYTSKADAIAYLREHPEAVGG